MFSFSIIKKPKVMLNLYVTYLYREHQSITNAQTYLNMSKAQIMAFVGTLTAVVAGIYVYGKFVAPEGSALKLDFKGSNSNGKRRR